jgi:hypothetical protein
MVAPTHAPTIRVPSRGFGLLQLAGLLVVSVAASLVLTMYLLRLDPSNTPAVVAPLPYRALFQSNDALWSIGQNNAPPALVTSLPKSDRLTLRMAPDGSRMVGIDMASSTPRLWLWQSPTMPPRVLTGPPPAFGTARWQLVDATWNAPRSVTVLLQQAGPGTPLIVGRFKIKTSGAITSSWLRSTFSGQNPLSLSPHAGQVASAEIQPARDGFAGQVAITLLRLSGQASSVALRYFGDQTPHSILWSSDGGTLAIQAPGMGLAIQKSSGRPVRLVADGNFPAAFSPLGAALAYVSGRGTTWQLHVLNLHGEIDSTLPVPAAGAPAALSWTPDARALLYRVGGGLWQIDASGGAATLLSGRIAGTVVAVLPAAATFADSPRS